MSFKLENKVVNKGTTRTFSCPQPLLEQRRKESILKHKANNYRRKSVLDIGESAARARRASPRARPFGEPPPPLFRLPLDGLDTSSIGSSDDDNDTTPTRPLATSIRRTSDPPLRRIGSSFRTDSLSSSNSSPLFPQTYKYLGPFKLPPPMKDMGYALRLDKIAEVRESQGMYKEALDMRLSQYCTAMVRKGAGCAEAVRYALAVSRAACSLRLFEEGIGVAEMCCTLGPVDVSEIMQTEMLIESLCELAKGKYEWSANCMRIRTAHHLRNDSARIYGKALSLLQADAALAERYGAELTARRAEVLLSLRSLDGIKEAEDTHNACIDVLEQFNIPQNATAMKAAVQSRDAFLKEKKRSERGVAVVRLQAFARGWIVRNDARKKRSAIMAYSRVGSPVVSPLGGRGGGGGVVPSFGSLCEIERGRFTSYAPLARCDAEESSGTPDTPPGCPPVGAGVAAVRAKRVSISCE